MAPSLARHESQRPDSRASTMSATSTSQHHDPNTNQMVYYQQEPEAALLQYHASNAQFGHHHSHSASFPGHNHYPSTDGGHVQSDMNMGGGPGSLRQASVPLSVGGFDAQQDDKRKKGAAFTATNDKELREMLAKNEGRPLSEVAHEVIAKERTPFAERTKQLFAMLWLRVVCKPAKTSVPRNRVYSQYATRCGTERVVPLNPASFGKLVRVIFPGIQTRRLGVRGESKYHYVDLALEEEHPSPYIQQTTNGSQFNQSESRPRRSDSNSTQHIDFNNLPRLQADTAAFPAAEPSFEVQPVQPPSPRGPPSLARTFAHPDTRTMEPGNIDALSYPHTLRFVSREVPTFSENEPVNLPSIQPYLPPRTDNDTADALMALYRTHCTSLIDSIRFCKEKQFFRLYTSFHGTLTVPVQKLFAHHSVAPWIEQCDLVMYRTMVRFVSRLTLQAAPVVVINILSNISANLHNHIVKTFSAQPPHVMDAKLRPATIFAGLLHRLIRVNQSAHAAANLLTIDQNREQMWREWTQTVNPKRVMEAELPDCGYEEVWKILTVEMRNLLEPLNAPSYNADPYAFGAYHFEENGDGFAQFLQRQNAPPSTAQGPSQVSTETVLDRWSAFIASLPARFPHAPTRLLLQCISGVGTAALRDITISNGLSYGHWWVLKIFVDEMALWLAEMGGFLEPDLSASTPSAPMYQSPALENGVGRSHSDSRVGSVAPDAQFRQGYQDQHSHKQHHQQSYHYHQQSRRHQHQPQLECDFSASMQQPMAMKHHDDIDDSGIGLGMEDDAMANFNMPAPQMAMHSMSSADMRV